MLVPLHRQIRRRVAVRRRDQVEGWMTQKGDEALARGEGHFLEVANAIPGGTRLDREPAVLLENVLNTRVRARHRQIELAEFVVGIREERVGKPAEVNRLLSRVAQRRLRD